MATASSKPVHVEIWSDPQCVWCFVAHPRFEKAVALFDGEVEVSYRSFELRPDAPIEINKEQQIAQHAGANRERIDTVNAQLAELARAEGVSYRPDLTRPTNSRLALELLHYADTAGHRAALTRRLFAAYFTEGRHIGHVDELIDLAQEIGLDPDLVREVLTDRRYQDAVTRDSERLQALGASGVPLYVINGTWGISGAQPVQTYLDALQKAANA
ncbi:FrnE protein [Leucobacter sp. 7(1)]|uniref:DsbA family oxidoreductase n=1 Tax=Leucobacter sp. 7(1) TaxID=1255613 RepID=UPI00097ECF7B|nr:DsbA family oxidoreductase [Leucobacter sp. 7(1)]SJN12075.1 FrnE protein [Leucobacter sp. 7(1)]